MIYIFAILFGLARMGIGAAMIGQDQGWWAVAGKMAEALALVRLGEGFWSLDSGDGPPVLADNYPYFEPVITLAEGGSWLHGHRIARR